MEILTWKNVISSILVYYILNLAFILNYCKLDNLITVLIMQIKIKIFSKKEYLYLIAGINATENVALLCLFPLLTITHDNIY